MSNKGIINNALHRPLSGGGGYNNLIPHSTCERTFLGAGDTFFSMEKIKSNILNNHTQCVKLAPKLQKGNLSDTVSAIYNFLYHHIQYKSDTENQNLRSPACSWSVREDGIDCKSFTIFSGCILTSLGVKYYIRKIKQPGMLPDQYTHVYIVVPKDQKTGRLKSGYYVIDATKHQNTEGTFIEKKDVFMNKLPHFGLQAPNPNQIGTIKGNFNPVTDEALQNFKEFLVFLKEIGIHCQIIRKIEETILSYIKQGINPYFAIAPHGIGVVIENELIPFQLEKFGVKKYKSPRAVAERMFGDSTGLKGGEEGGQGTSGQGEDQWYSEMGEELWGAVKDEMEDSGWWDKTFGEWFANDWMLFCFKTSNSPKRSTQQVQIDILDYIEKSGIADKSRGGLTTANFQNFMDRTSAYIAHRNFGKNNGDIDKCTRAGNEVGHRMMSEGQNEIFGQALTLLRENGGDILPGKEKDLGNYNFGPTASGYLNSTGGIHTDSRFKSLSQHFTIKTPSKPVVITPPSGNTGGGQTGGGTSSGGGGTSSGGGGTSSGGGGTSSGGGGTSSGGGGTKPPANPNNPWNYIKPAQAQKAGMNQILAVGLVAGAIYMAYKKRNDGNSK